MSAEVVSLAQHREENTPHNTGDARCLACGHKWIAVAPVGTDWLECSECHLMKGRFIHHCEREGAHWNCNCGNDLFFITPDGCYCPVCGSWQKGF